MGIKLPWTMSTSLSSHSIIQSTFSDLKTGYRRISSLCVPFISPEFILTHRTFTKAISIGLSALVLTACVGTDVEPQKPQDVHQLTIPSSWQQTGFNPQKINNDWFSSMAQGTGPLLTKLVEQALLRNPNIERQRLAVEIQQQQLERADAVFWPSLDWQLNAQRRTIADGSIINDFSNQVNISYEVDIWGKLSDTQKQANLDFLATRESFRQARQQLVANVVTLWFNLLAEQQLLSVSQQRVNVSRQNLQIIESGYEQGLNSALDVYLTRNELNNELSQIALRNASVAEFKRQLRQIAGDYPDTSLDANLELPDLSGDISVGVPSTLLTRQPQVLSAWYQLLSQNAALAFAHKQRYPSINLRGSGDLSGEKLKDWLSGDFGWSLLAGISAPIFDAGNLKANEQIARLQLKQAEQTYIEGVLSAFGDVENGIGQELAIKERIKAMLEAEKNANGAMTLAFEQYQSGLVSLTTVLDAQNRAFAAQSTVINLKNQLLANRVALHVSLGGEFAQHSAESFNP